LAFGIMAGLLVLGIVAAVLLRHVQARKSLTEQVTLLEESEPPQPDEEMRDLFEQEEDIPI